MYCYDLDDSGWRFAPKRHWMWFVSFVYTFVAIVLHIRNVSEREFLLCVDVIYVSDRTHERNQRRLPHL